MLDKEFLISIIVPVFNAELTVENTFNSIKNQSIGFENIEVIFVDDCSKDNSRTILENFSKSYDNVKSIFLKENHGFAGEARNVGVLNASSKYLMFIDSDDIFYPDACEFLYRNITEKDMDLVSGNYVLSVDNEKTTNVWPIAKFNEQKIYMDSVKDDGDVLLLPPAIMSKIFKKSIILENNIKFPKGVPGEDLVFSTQYFLKAKGILFINFPIFEYIIRNDENNKSVSYERGKRYLLGLTDSYRDLFYILLKFDKSFIYPCVSRLYYWISQFISTNLDISDRIELLKYAEFLFAEFNNMERFKPAPSIELIFDFVKEKNFFEAAKFSELLYIQNSLENKKLNQSTDFHLELFKKIDINNPSKSKPFKINENVKHYYESLADIRYKIDFFKKVKFDKNLIMAIKKIKKWNLFDEDFYKSRYDYDLDLDPFLHYLFIGFKEGKNPKENFQGIFYEQFYDNAYKSDLNPLIYFVLEGIDKGEFAINENIYPYHKQINLKVFREKFNNFDELGINLKERDRKIIISLTSFPERMYDISFCLYSLLTQSLKPDKVVLWLAKSQFPNGELDIPQEVLNLRKNGLLIEWCEDLGSYKKLIPSLKKFPNDIIITADDDLYYHKDWLKQLYDDYKLYPNDIICQRSRKISFNSENQLKDYMDWKLTFEEEEPSYLNLSTNGAGSLFPPNSLHPDVVKEELFKNLCPKADDIWIWAMAVLNNTKIKGIKNPMSELIYINVAREVNILNEETLYSSNKLDNNIQIKKVLEHYPKILKNIKDDLERN